jgi:hypothetical protein
MEVFSLVIPDEGELVEKRKERHFHSTSAILSNNPDHSGSKAAFETHNKKAHALRCTGFGYCDSGTLGQSNRLIAVGFVTQSSLKSSNEMDP